MVSYLTIFNLTIKTYCYIEIMQLWEENMIGNITKTHFGIYGICRSGNKILLIKKARGPYTGLYDLPGGSPEKNESFEETLIREIKEETNFSVTHITNQRKATVIFSDFTQQSGEKGVLKHEAVLFDITVSGEISYSGDGLDSNGAVWIDIDLLSDQNATPYALIGAGRKQI